MWLNIVIIGKTKLTAGPELWKLPAVYVGYATGLEHMTTQFNRRSTEQKSAMSTEGLKKSQKLIDYNRQ